MEDIIVRLIIRLIIITRIITIRITMVMPTTAILIMAMGMHIGINILSDQKYIAFNRLGRGSMVTIKIR
jgi:hypothetical protein